jgi:hypothetical protein
MGARTKTLVREKISTCPASSRTKNQSSSWGIRVTPCGRASGRVRRTCQKKTRYLLILVDWASMP